MRLLHESGFIFDEPDKFVYGIEVERKNASLGIKFIRCEIYLPIFCIIELVLSHCHDITG